jgi:hypothetical protein
VKREYREKFQLDVMPPLGFNNITGQPFDDTAKQPMADQEEPVHDSPQDEIPARAVPEASQRHRDHQVAGRLPFAIQMDIHKKAKSRP